MFEAPTALVIDDSPIVRAVLTGLLRRQGFAVTSERDGEAGMERAAALAPSIIFLDLMLPNTPGLEVCRRLRALPATRAIPIVIISARPYPQDRAAASDAGADAYVLKPFGDHEVESTVRTLLWQRRDGRRAS